MPALINPAKDIHEPALVKTTLEGTKYQSTRKILRVECYTPIAKPLNGPTASSTLSTMLRLTLTPYTYSTTGKKGLTKKQSTVSTYYIKGLRGLLRHSMMSLCKKHGIEVCHTSEKTHTKAGERLIPSGFHPLGECQGKCIIHRIFGALGSKSKIKIWADPIAYIPHKTAELQTPVQNVYIGTDRRVALSYTGKAIQDFQQHYFSGTFQFQIDVTETTKEELGAIIDTILNLQQLGASKQSGSGFIHPRKIQLVNSTTTGQVTKNDSWYQTQNTTSQQLANQEITTALEAWRCSLEQSAIQ